MTLIQADATNLPYPDKFFHACVTSPPYWGLRKYAGEQGEEPLGLEATPERHIERMVEVFREVRRVLRDDGVCWLNYADCFIDGQLALMPHRLAIALQADGWIVRNDLVWFKRNPMPESVAGWRWERSKKEKGRKKDFMANKRGDGYFNDQSGSPDLVEWEYGDDYVLRKSSWRHTRAHEYVFQLVKGMGYYCNQEVVRELTGNESSWEEYGSADGHGMPSGTLEGGVGAGFGAKKSAITHPSGRNPRSVLDVPTAPYKGAHYATFPPKLIAPLIRASVPRRCCPECGMAWAPVVKKMGGAPTTKQGRINAGGQRDASHFANDGKTGNPDYPPSGADGFGSVAVTDYRPTCECGVTEHEPGIVLDIFGGSGTTGMVAKQLMRRWVVMDISRPYLDEQAKVRTGSGTPSKALEGLPMFGGEDETE